MNVVVVLTIWEDLSFRQAHTVSGEPRRVEPELASSFTVSITKWSITKSLSFLSFSNHKPPFPFLHHPSINPCLPTDCHFHVEKHTKDGRTATIVRNLSHAERVEELARMVGGAKVTPQARAHAEELIRHAREAEASGATAAATAPTKKDAKAKGGGRAAAARG